MVFNCSGLLCLGAVILSSSLVLGENMGIEEDGLDLQPGKNGSIASRPDYFLSLLESNGWMVISVLVLLVGIFLIETLIVLAISKRKNSEIVYVRDTKPPSVKFFSYRNIRHPYYSI